MVCIQEVHSDDATIRDAAARLRSTHLASHSAGAAHDTGGVLILIRHDLANAATLRTTVILPGRIIMTNATTTDGSTAHVVNVHNHDVPDTAVRTLREYLHRAADAAPPEYVFLAGDWNFPSDSGGTTLTTTGRGDTVAGRATTMRNAWRSALRLTTELGHEFPTRAAEIKTDATIAITMSSIDRAYTTIPPHVLAEVATTVEVGRISDTLATAHRAPTSDHAYVTTAMRLRPPLPPHVRPIPTWITRHPLYTQEVRRRLDALHSEALHPHDALRRTKQIIRMAAAATRDKCLHRRPTTLAEFTQLGLQAARALTRGDEALLRKVGRAWPAARVTMTTTGGATTVHDLPSLTRLIGRHRRPRAPHPH